MRSGGRLEDLLVGRTGERLFPEATGARVKRMFGVSGRWMDEHELSEVARERTLRVCERLLGVLTLTPFSQGG